MIFLFSENTDSFGDREGMNGKEHNFEIKVEYIQRYEMLFQFDSCKIPDEEVDLPPDYVWFPWNDRLADVYARVQYLGFRGEVDSEVFPTFRRFDSCWRLVQYIMNKPEFMPKASWLIGEQKGAGNGFYCAMIQCSRKSKERGKIENIAVLQQYRHHGLGTAIIYKALQAFQKAGCCDVLLEATARNENAVHLYQKLGFKIIKTTFKETYVA
ncbi:MAG: N-acetyltransferase [Planctomycetia bacterium]|nr:N-acetyltransferase [Planctomycetia bacterium]